MTCSLFRSLYYVNHLSHSFLRSNIYESEIIPGKNAMRSQQQSHEKEALSEKGIILGDNIFLRQNKNRSAAVISPHRGPAVCV